MQELETSVSERTQELEDRVREVEKLNQAMSNLLTDLRANQKILQKSQAALVEAHILLQQERIHEQASLLELSQGLLELYDRDGILNFAVHQAAQALQTEFAAIALLDETGALFGPKALAGWSNEIQPAISAPLESDLMMGDVIRTKTMLVIPDIHQEKKYTHPEFVKKEGISASLLAPLIRGDQSIGGLAIHDRRTRVWTEEEVHLLTLMANATAQALERVRLFESEQQRRVEAELLREASAAVTSTLELNQIIQSILSFVKTAVGYKSAAVFLVSPQDGDPSQEGWLKLSAGIGFPDIEVLQSETFSLGNPF